MKEVSKVFLMDMDYIEARQFMLESDSYVSLNFPVYYNFDNLLEYAINLLGESFLVEKQDKYLIDKKYSSFSNINYTIQLNKSKDHYRPITIIHPLLYLDLVNLITKKENWKILIDRYNFLVTKIGDKIICESIPFKTNNKRTGVRYAFHYWENIEQESIKLSLEYSNLLHVDIANFYGSIYTHMIPWSIHDEDIAKAKKGEKSLLGNKIDGKFQFMNYGETVAIPQGNVVSDFIAELLLRYIDTLLVQELEAEDIDYKILRYRDDYRIFTQNKEDEKKIKKKLVELLCRHKLTISENKVKNTEDLIIGSLKADKVYWIEHDPNVNIKVDWKLFFKHKKKRHFVFPVRAYKTSIQKHLIIIKLFADKFPNSGQLIKALKEFEKRIVKLEDNDFKKLGTEIGVLIAIVFKIIEDNPKVIDVGTKLLARLFNKLGDDTSEINNDTDNFTFGMDNSTSLIYESKFRVINAVLKKISKQTSNAYLEIWLQRLVIKVINEHGNFQKEYISQSNENMVRLTNDILCNGKSDITLFNEEWIKEEFRVKWDQFIDIEKIKVLKSTISMNEIRCSEYSGI